MAALSAATGQGGSGMSTDLDVCLRVQQAMQLDCVQAMQRGTSAEGHAGRPAQGLLHKGPAHCIHSSRGQRCSLCVGSAVQRKGRHHQPNAGTMDTYRHTHLPSSWELSSLCVVLNTHLLY